jgi:hypothetical protein
LRQPRDTLYPQKLAQITSTTGSRSVGIVRSRTKATEFSLVLVYYVLIRILSRRICVSVLSLNHVKSLGVNIHTMLPHRIQLKLVFHRRYVLVEVLSKRFFDLMLISESHGGVSRDILYHATTLQMCVL